MSGRLPWFTFFPLDWLGSTVVRRLSHEQRGVLIDLFAHAWQFPGGILPADMVEVASGLPPHRIEALARVLATCFVEVPGGFLPSEPFDFAEQRAKADAWVAQRAAAGRRSAEERRLRDGTAQPHRPDDRSSEPLNNPPNDRSGMSNDRSSEPPNDRSSFSNGLGMGMGVGVRAESGVDVGKRTLLEGNERNGLLESKEEEGGGAGKFRAAPSPLREQLREAAVEVERLERLKERGLAARRCKTCAEDSCAKDHGVEDHRP